MAAKIRARRTFFGTGGFGVFSATFFSAATGTAGRVSTAAVVVVVLVLLLSGGGGVTPGRFPRRPG